jgi:hypothetical protein
MGVLNWVPVRSPSSLGPRQQPLPTTRWGRHAGIFATLRGYALPPSPQGYGGQVATRGGFYDDFSTMAILGGI